MIVAVSGWRHWPDRESVELGLDAIKGLAISVDHFVIRVGDCPTGADKFVWDICLEAGQPYERFLADWDGLGKYAGGQRNYEMLKGIGTTERKANLLLAFPEPKKFPNIPGSGTWNCMGTATKLGIPIYTHPSPKLQPVSPSTFVEVYGYAE